MATATITTHATTGADTGKTDDPPIATWVQSFVLAIDGCVWPRSAAHKAAALPDSVVGMELNMTGIGYRMCFFMKLLYQPDAGQPPIIARC